MQTSNSVDLSEVKRLIMALMAKYVLSPYSTTRDHPGAWIYVICHSTQRMEYYELYVEKHIAVNMPHL